MVRDSPLLDEKGLKLRKYLESPKGIAEEKKTLEAMKSKFLSDIEGLNR